VKNAGNGVAHGGYSQGPTWCLEEVIQDGERLVSKSRCSNQGHYYTMFIR